MTDRKALIDSNDTPEDVATLYSWANLHGAKYRDFSASRAQTREKARQRVEDAIESERRRAREEGEAHKAAEAMREAEAARQVEMEKLDAAMAEKQAAAQEAHEAARNVAQRQWQAPSNMPQSQPQQAQAQPSAPAAQLQAPYPPMQQNQYQAPQPAYNPEPDPQQPFAAAAQYQAYPQQAPPTYSQPEHNFAVRPTWQPAPEAPVRPAWLGVERSEAPAPRFTQSQDDTLQGSRDRLTSRWFALKGVFSPSQPAENLPAPIPTPSRAPVLAVFSLAGGVGKTSIVASLGRALSSRGERVVLVDTAAFGLLPFYFGARDQRPGVLRTFTAPGSDAPVQMLTVDPDTLGPENAPQERLAYEISRNSQGASRVIVDVATASGATTRRLLRMAPTVLVPVIPDMSSVVSVNAIDTFFRNNSAAGGAPVMPVYLLNQFDPAVPLHLDVREVLREQLGDRLLPFALRRAPAVSEALAEGMTVVDYAPTSTVAEDFGALAGWVKSLAAPATSGFRGVRWSER